jgi:hypothetical protein
MTQRIMLMALSGAGILNQCLMADAIGAGTEVGTFSISPSLYDPYHIQYTYYEHYTFPGAYSGVTFTVHSRDLLGNSHEGPANSLFGALSIVEDSGKAAEDYLPTLRQAADRLKADTQSVKQFAQTTYDQLFVSLCVTYITEISGYSAALAAASPAVALAWTMFDVLTGAQEVILKAQEYHYVVDAMQQDKALMDQSWKIYSDFAGKARYPTSADLTGVLTYDDPQTIGIVSHLGIADHKSPASAPIVTVPEPSGIMLLCSGLSLIAAVRWTRVVKRRDLRRSPRATPYDVHTIMGHSS